MKKLLLPLALAALALCGCDGIFYSRHDVPSPVLLLTPQWHGQEPTAAELEVTVTGTDPGGLEPRTLTLAAGGTARVEVPQGTYRITATHGAEGVALAGTHFTLTPGADGLLPEPQAFCAAVATATVTQGGEHAVALSMQPYTRQLRLRLHLTEEAAAVVTHMEAQLSGTATAIALADHSTPSATQPGTVRLDLIPTDGTHTPADGKPLFYTALRRLPAMHPSARQVLTLRLAYSNGQVQTLRHDLTQALRTFNHYDAGTPPFEADLLVELAGKPGSGLGFSIRPWAPGGGDGNGDAGMEIPK